MHAHAAPLSRFNIVDTRSPDEARQEIGRIFCPHFLSPTTARPAGFHAVHNSAHFDGFSLNFVAYGASVEIDPGELSRFFLLQIPVKGSAKVRCGTSAIDAHTGHSASVLSPTLPTRMVWHENCEKIIVLLNRETLTNQYAALTHHVTDRIEFATAIDLTGSMGRAIHRHVGLMLEAAEDRDATGPSYHIALRDSLTTLMLTGLNHNRSLAFTTRPPEMAPSAVRRAEDFILENADRPISMADVAQASGSCLRSLQGAFRRHRGMTLTERLQEARLTRFRQTLLSHGGATVSVAEIAFASGFGHLGRAAALYRQRFGETPSETLRRQ